MINKKPLRCVVLISGRGSNLAAMIKARDTGIVPLDIARVISNKPHAAGLGLAQAAGIPVSCIESRDFPERDSFDLQLLQLIDECSPDLIVLAGFMRILGAHLVDHLANRAINLHPSLLPKYPGLDTYTKVLEAGDTSYGSSIHFVTKELDAGTIISQARAPVFSTDTSSSLSARLQPLEHKLLIATLQLFYKHTISCKNDMLLVDENTYKQPFILASDGCLHAPYNH